MADREAGVWTFTARSIHRHFRGVAVGVVFLTLATAASGALITADQGASRGDRLQAALLGVGIALGGVLLVVALYALLVAPYKQRNEARRDAALLRQLDADRLVMDISVDDYAACDPLPNGLCQASLDIHNNGPDSEFDAWVPKRAVDWNGPEDLYGGFNLHWELKPTDHVWIPSGSEHRVDVALVDATSGRVRFLGPGRTSYTELAPNDGLITGYLDIRDRTHGGNRRRIDFRLSIDPETRLVTMQCERVFNPDETAEPHR